MEEWKNVLQMVLLDARVHMHMVVLRVSRSTRSIILHNA